MENKYVKESFINKLFSDKKRLLILIFSILTVICSFLNIAKLNLGAIPLIAFLCFIMSSISNIIYTLDIDEKNKHSNDILIVGIGISIVGLLLRVIQTGLSQNWDYFAGYFMSVLAMTFTLLKMTKCVGRGRYIIALLSLLVAYNVFSFFYYTNSYVKGYYWKLYFIAQAFLFLSYIVVLFLNKGKFEDFKNKLSGYSAQIPSLKISVLLISFISAIPLCIGLFNYFDSQSTNNTNQSAVVSSQESSSSSKENTISSKNTSSTSSGSSVPDTDITSINVGDTITTQDKSIKINKVSFSYDVLPDITTGYYSHYEAKSGKVYIDIDVDITNTGKTSIEGKKSIDTIIADYNNGYTYKGFIVLQDDKGTHLNTYESIDPLVTRRGHALIDCPQDVETSDKPLFVVLTVDKQKYKITIR